MIHRARRAISIAGALAMFGGCTVAFDADRGQCESNEDCAESVTGVAGLRCNSGLCTDASGEGPWGCAGPLVFPNPPVPVTVTRAFVDLINNRPVQVEVVVCTGLSPTCENRITDPVTSDENGVVTFQVTSGTEGFMEITSATHLPGIALFGPVDRDEVDPLPQPLVTAQAYTGLAMASGVPLDIEGSGHLFIGTFPCPGQSPAGVSYSVDRDQPNTSSYYLQNGIPSFSATRTDELGRAGFVNLPEGFVTLIATEAATDRRLGTIAFLSRRGWVSSVGFATDDVDVGP